jgi:hypothetical protein
MKTKLMFLVVAVAVGCVLFLFAQQPNMPSATPKAASAFDRQVEQSRNQMFEEGKHIFRFDTFGDELFWGGTLRLHEAIAGEKNGGVGPGVSPKAALGVGLKVDADVLPPELV